MKYHIPVSLLCSLFISLSCVANPLRGHISNKEPIIKFQRQCAKADKRGKILTGKIKQTHLKGLIGVRYDSATGEIKYIYPESDLNRYNIKAGDYILKVEHEAFRPCLLPYISFYPKGWILNLTIRSKGGNIRVIPVRLIDAKNIIDRDS